MDPLCRVCWYRIAAACWRMSSLALPPSRTTCDLIHTSTRPWALLPGAFPVPRSLSEAKRIHCTNDGANHLHGGLEDFSRKVWKAEAEVRSDATLIRLTCNSRSGEEGYPRTVRVTLTPLANDISYLTANNQIEFQLHMAVAPQLWRISPGLRKEQQGVVLPCSF